MLIREVAVGVVLTAIGCTSTQRVQPAQFVPQRHPQSIMVTTTDSDVTNVMAPKIDGDTLRGTVAGLQERVAIPLKNIVTATAKAPDGTMTAILVGGGLVVGGVVAYMLSTQKNNPVAPGPNPMCADPDGVC
jgi:hypothetical protein